MADFRTKVKLNHTNFSINHNSTLLAVGSCFVEHVGLKLVRDKFKVNVNPFGIIYNPVSISESLKYIINDHAFMHNELFVHENKWHSYKHHGSFSKNEVIETQKAINDSIHKAHLQIKELDFLIVTLGTANYFYHEPTQQIVANCHRLPTDQFVRKRFSVTEVTGTLMPVLEQLKRLNNKLKVILTISPVRYLRDGLIESNRSKATLLLAADQMSNLLSYVDYFPAYELVMDDLRNYRFYKEDMAHPNQLAVDYVYQKFQDQYMNEATQKILSDISKIEAARNHRPRNPNSEEHHNFLSRHARLANNLASKYPTLNFQEDLNYFLRPK